MYILYSRLWISVMSQYTTSFIFPQFPNNLNAFYPSPVYFFVMEETHKLIYKGDLHVAYLAGRKILCGR